MTATTASVVITDLDDTLYDWLELWYRPFRRLLACLTVASDVTRAELLRDFRHLHQQHRTSECSFLLQELPCLQRSHLRDEITAIYSESLHAYHSERLNHMHPFPGVLDTLQVLKKRGCLMIGFSEGLEFYVNERLRRMDLDGLLDYLYSPPDHPLPPDFRRYHDDAHYQLDFTEHRILAHDVAKPDQTVLLDILDDFGLSPDQVIYIGDKLYKDVLMAQQAGVRDVYAKYGEGAARVGYGLLRRVSHWTDADIERERKLHAVGEVEPTYTLHESFSELLELFSFKRHIRPTLPREINSRNKDQAALAVRAWERTVEVQQHFNNLELRIRNLALTVLTAVLGAAAFASAQGITVGSDSLTVAAWLPGLVLVLAMALLAYFIPGLRRLAIGVALLGAAWIPGELIVFKIGTLGAAKAFEMPAALGLLLVGFIVWTAFWFMDRLWYHRLLYGAVEHGGLIERRWRFALPELGLGAAISKHSPLVSDRLNLRLRSPKKIDLFYLAGLVALGALTLLFAG